MRGPKSTYQKSSKSNTPEKLSRNSVENNNSLNNSAKTKIISKYTKLKISSIEEKEEHLLNFDYINHMLEDR